MSIPQIPQLHKMAQQALNQRDFTQAQRALIAILNQDAQFYDAYFLLGVIEAELGTFSKATVLIEKAISLKPQAEYSAHLAKCYALMGETNKTYAAIKQAESFTIDQALTFDTLGVALSRIGDHEKAVGYFDKAISLKPMAAFYYNLGASRTFLGQFDLARVAYESAIELEPLFYQAHSSLSHLGGISEDNNHIDRLKQTLQQMPHPDGQLHLAHALARELETLKKPKEGFQYLSKAKERKRQKLNYQFSQDKAIFDALKQSFQVAKSKSYQAEYSDSEPVFVVGMPRSGTTLIERVLTNNNVVKSAGELQEFGLALKKLCQTKGQHILDVETVEASRTVDLAELGNHYIDSLASVVAKGQRFLDKMPLNVLYGGFIAESLPKAKIICVIRNPMDTVWGNYKQLFSLNDPYYNYAYDETTIALYYAEFVALAEFWQERYPEQFKIVSYDEFVTEPEIKGKEIIEFCGLEFEESMLDITKNTSAVATASSVQVRSGINTKSLGNWRKLAEELSAAVEVFERNKIDLGPYKGNK